MTVEWRPEGGQLVVHRGVAGVRAGPVHDALPAGPGTASSITVPVKQFGSFSFSCDCDCDFFSAAASSSLLGSLFSLCTVTVRRFDFFFFAFDRLGRVRGHLAYEYSIACLGLWCYNSPKPVDVYL